MYEPILKWAEIFEKKKNKYKKEKDQKSSLQPGFHSSALSIKVQLLYNLYLCYCYWFISDKWVNKITVMIVISAKCCVVPGLIRWSLW